MDDLIAFLRNREDEREQEACCGDESCSDACDCFDHDCEFTWTRRDVDAKRQIIDVYERHAAYWAADPALADRDYRVMNAEMDAFILVLRLLALSYAGHPEYREEWRP